MIKTTIGTEILKGIKKTTKIISGNGNIVVTIGGVACTIGMLGITIARELKNSSNNNDRMKNITPSFFMALIIIIGFCKKNGMNKSQVSRAMNFADSICDIVQTIKNGKHHYDSIVQNTMNDLKKSEAHGTDSKNYEQKHKNIVIVYDGILKGNIATNIDELKNGINKANSILKNEGKLTIRKYFMALGISDPEKWLDHYALDKYGFKETIRVKLIDTKNGWYELKYMTPITAIE